MLDPRYSRRMDFNQVRYFLALADTLNFTRAAERCYVSQPALTQAIKRLEDELDGELIRRDGRNTELTELGRSLRGHFEQIDRTRHLVHTTAKAVTEGEISELNIGVMCTVGPGLISGMLDAFLMAHPMVSVVLHDVTGSAIPELLLAGAIDGALCARRGPPHPQLEYVDLFDEDMVIIFAPGHPFSNMDRVPVKEIASQRYVDRLHCEFREDFLSLFGEEGLELNVVFRSQREDWIQALVLKKMGVSLIPRHSLLNADLEHRLVDPPLSRKVELALPGQSSPKPALKLFVEQARSHAWPTAERSTRDTA